MTPNGNSEISPFCMSGDGRYVAFSSEADNFGIKDTNSVRDVFLADLSDGSIRLVSAGTNGFPANGLSTDASVSNDGRYVAFSSLAGNLVPGDTNLNSDAFVKDLQLGTVTRVSRDSGPFSVPTYPAYASQ